MRREQTRRAATGISGAGSHGITRRVSGLTGKADAGGGLSTNHPFHRIIFHNLIIIISFFLILLKCSRCCLCHSWEGTFFRREVFTDPGVEPK
jgi:hypothetical protein